MGASSNLALERVHKREIARPKTSTGIRRKETHMSRKTIMLLVAAVVVVGGAAAWFIFSKPGLPPGIAGGNGRLEATEYFISTKYPGRIKEVLFNEGDTVNPGQVVAHMDTSALDEQPRA